MRNDRKAANQELKKLEEISEDQLKDAEGEVQELTDKFIARIDEILVVKEKEIMTV